MWPARRRGSAVVDVFWRDLALDDLEEGEVSIAEARTAFNEGGTAGSDLTHSLGNEIDKDRWLSDVLGGFFDEVCSHRCKTAWDTGVGRVVVSGEVANEMWPDLRLMKEEGCCLIASGLELAPTFYPT